MSASQGILLHNNSAIGLYILGEQTSISAYTKQYSLKGTTAEDPNRFYTCQLKTGIWQYHGLIQTGQYKIKKYHLVIIQSLSARFWCVFAHDSSLLFLVAVLWLFFAHLGCIECLLKRTISFLADWTTIAISHWDPIFPMLLFDVNNNMKLLTCTCMILWMTLLPHDWRI